MVALGENGVKNRGRSRRLRHRRSHRLDRTQGDGRSKHEPGFLDGLGISREDAETMIMQARLKAGWVTEAELAPPPSAEAEPEEARQAAGLRESGRAMLAVAQDNSELDRGATTVAPGTERTCALSREKALKPVAGDDPLRVGTEWVRRCPTSSANFPAAASGLPRPAVQSRTRLIATSSLGGFKREVRIARDLCGADRAPGRTCPRLTRWQSRGKPARRGCRFFQRLKRRSAGTISWH